MDRAAWHVFAPSAQHAAAQSCGDATPPQRALAAGTTLTSQSPLAICNGCWSCAYMRVARCQGFTTCCCSLHTGSAVFSARHWQPPLPPPPSVTPSTPSTSSPAPT